MSLILTRLLLCSIVSLFVLIESRNLSEKSGRTSTLIQETEEFSFIDGRVYNGNNFLFLLMNYFMKMILLLNRLCTCKEVARKVQKYC